MREGERQVKHGIALFTDVSLNPKRTCGAGSWLARPVSILEIPPRRIAGSDMPDA
jgi:hypothetical protein